jgi:hypothetical protein
MRRREFLQVAGVAVSPAVLARQDVAGLTNAVPANTEQQIITMEVRAALDNTLYPALRERVYPGHYSATADGAKYGSDITWPGLDAWQTAGAYLLLGKHREVLDCFDFVQASQRPDGHIPMAIFPADTPPPAETYSALPLRYPEDVYTYKPVVRPGQPKYSDMSARKWIGLFTHWQEIANPLGVLAPISFILTGQEIYAATKSSSWLTEKLPVLEAAGRYILTQTSRNGLIRGAGFYIESPPRNQWDGITQCYGIRVFRQLAALNEILGRWDAGTTWNRHAEALRARFLEVFWQRDHFAEYVHPEHGLVDSHGLSDVNWAAIGLEVATDNQIKRLWPILMHEPMFWRGGMPTHLVTRPHTYQRWELSEPLPFEYDSWTFDVAAMGRVWYLEVLACLQMHETGRLRESVLKVCQRGQKDGGFWYERYPGGEGDTVKPGGAYRYCEYAAILVRAVLGNPAVFPESRNFGSESKQTS